MDPHHLLEAWLVEGADGDPPREVAVHAAVCASCARRLGAFDALALLDVAAAGSPRPLAARSRIVIGLEWARVGAAIAGTVVAGIIVDSTRQAIEKGAADAAAPVQRAAAVAISSSAPDIRPQLRAIRERLAAALAA